MYYNCSLKAAAFHIDSRITLSSLELRPTFLVNSAKIKCNSDFSSEGMRMCFSSKLSPTQYP